MSDIGSRSPDAHRLWGGRFAHGPAPELDRINRSLPVDWRLWPYELVVDRAWVDELAAGGTIGAATAERLREALDRVRSRFEETADPSSEPDEDVHTLVERWLADEVGDEASRIRLGRSRNDVVATDTRLWALDAIGRVAASIRALQEAILDTAGRSPDVLFPAYTHLQRAQPTVAAHWLLSHFWPMVRARDRLADLRHRVARLPLGAAAGTGTTLPVDRERLARRLGFDGPCENSLDATGSRDWVAETLYSWAQAAVDLSRLAEDVVVYASAEFGLLRLDDAFSTGSSLMPHKRNPDGAELARARGGTLVGALAGFLASLKGLPTGYSKDLQEDKRILFDSEEALLEALRVMAGTVGTLQFDVKRAASSVTPEMLTADAAERLAASGLPFREAHELLGRLVRHAERTDTPLPELWGEAAAAVDPRLAAIEPAWWDVGEALARRSAIGGSSQDSVRRQMERARAELER